MGTDTPGEDAEVEGTGAAGEQPAAAPRPVPRPGPRPRPMGTPAPPRTPAPPAAPPAAPDRAAEQVETEAREWGRVAEDGTVFVRDPDSETGERPVGQVPDATPEAALSFFTRRYVDLVFEIELLERRVRARALGPDEAATSVKQVRATLRDAHAVGDLAGLEARLDALTETISGQREERRVERARKLEEAKAAKERIADDAERLSAGDDWRNGANRMRALLDEWKALPRIDKAADDALWRRFSGARTTYTRRRKAHFAEVNEQRESARVVKDRLVKEAEELAGSRDWGPTAGRYRDLMREWKAAGPAPKGVDDQLWKRFRAAQDAFFGARDAANAEVDREFAANAEKKEALLVEAEALVPVTDLAAAKQAIRAIADRWEAAGKVPRERVRELEGRMRRVEQAIRDAEDVQWRRSNPEARARAAATIEQLQASIARLEKAAARPGEQAEEAAAALEARRAWLVEAQRALDDFGG